MKSQHLFALTIVIVSCMFTTEVSGGYSALTWKDSGSQTVQTGTIASCGAPRTVDIRVSYSLNQVFIIGEPDANCPGGFGPNPFRFTVTLYRDGLQLSVHTFQSAGCWFRDWHTGVAAVPGSYYAAVKLERRVAPFAWLNVDYIQSPMLIASKSAAVPILRINGISPPSNGQAIDVNILYPIVLDGSATHCAANYFVGVEESYANWERTSQYEWGKWFPGTPPPSTNLQQLSTAHSIAPDWLGTDPARQGTPLVGGFIDAPTNLYARFYRIALCTDEPAWACDYALIRVH